MKKIFLVLMIGLLAGNVGWGQNIWTFGDKAMVNFTNTTVHEFPMTNSEGVACFSDLTGNLLFATNGRSIYNRLGEEKIYGLNGSEYAAQSSIICRRPGFPNQYFVFTVDDWTTFDNIKPGPHYTLVDFSSPLNPVIVKDGNNVELKNIQLDNGCCEQVTATCDNNGGFWIVSHRYNSRDYIAFHLDNTGNLNTTPVVSQGNMEYPVQSGNNRYGYLRFSPNSSLLSNTLGGVPSVGNLATLELMSFNVATGIFSNPRALLFSAHPNTDMVFADVYCSEFSPSSRFLYVTGLHTKVVKIDLSTTTPVYSEVLNANTGAQHYSLQLAPDGNIYVNNNGDNFISRIENPNSTSNFVSNAYTLKNGTFSNGGFPNFQSCITINSPCARCHNVGFTFGGNFYRTTVDTTIVLKCSNRSLNFIPNSGCNAPLIVPVIGCTVTDQSGNAVPWATGFTNANGSGILNIPLAASPPATYFIDYFYGTTRSPGPGFDTCDRIRITIVDSCIDVPCTCPPKPLINLTQVGRPGITKQLNCPATEEIDCGKLYTIEVDPNCQPAGCSDKSYEIAVSANGGPTLTFINQPVNIQPLVTDRSFKITIKTYCGGKLCTTCVITLTVKCKCPPPPCCPAPVVTNFNQAVSTIRNVAGTSMANLAFDLNGNGKRYTQVRASVISFGLHADDKKCFDCYNNSRQWASILGGGLTGVTGFNRIITGAGSSSTVNTREVTYTSVTSQVINTAQLTMNLVLPPMEAMSCCNLYATVYIKFTFRDNECNECEKIIGIKIPLSGEAGKSPELITRPANVRVAGPAR